MGILSHIFLKKNDLQKNGIKQEKDKHRFIDLWVGICVCVCSLTCFKTMKKNFFIQAKNCTDIPEKIIGVSAVWHPFKCKSLL